MIIDDDRRGSIGGVLGIMLVMVVMFVVLMVLVWLVIVTMMVLSIFMTVIDGDSRSDDRGVLRIILVHGGYHVGFIDDAVDICECDM